MRREREEGTSISREREGGEPASLPQDKVNHYEKRRT